LYNDGAHIFVQVFHKLLFEILINSLSAISTKLLTKFVHSQIASRVIIQSLFDDFDFTCQSSDKLSLHIPKILFVYEPAAAVDQIRVLPFDAT